MDDFEKDLAIVNKAGDDYSEAKYVFMRQIMLISASLLGILASFHRVSISSDSIRTCYQLSLVSLALGLVSLTVASYGLVSSRNVTSLHLQESFVKKFRNPDYIPEAKSKSPGRIYVFCEKIGYASLLVAVLLITAYAILIA